MLAQHSQHLIFVVYDGIENSVFQSQVLNRLFNDINEQPNLTITLISFEQKKFSQKKLANIIPKHERLHVVIRHKVPFIGVVSLFCAMYQFENLLKNVPSCDALMARGPLAGFIVKHARMAKRLPITIQARGLCAQEYRYTHQKQSTSWLKKKWYTFIFKQLEWIEKEVYGAYKDLNNSVRGEESTVALAKEDVSNHVSYNIEAVSPALKTYLIDHFKAEGSQITIATQDLPQKIEPTQIALWRNETRQELGIASDAPVYCYSGSYKPWQCASESVVYFVEQYKKNRNSIMLVLSPDSKKFIQELQKSGIPSIDYRVTWVPASTLYRYLAAADFGLLLREHDIINWVSRPTKMLEYEAVGLKIVHNNSVAWLKNEL